MLSLLVWPGPPPGPGEEAAGTQGSLNASDRTIGGALVAEIEVVGPVALAEEVVLHYLRLEQGEPFEADAVNAGIHDLWSTGLIEDVEVTAPEVENGLLVRVAVEERLRIATVSFRTLESLGRDLPERLAAQLGVALAQGSVVDRSGLAQLAGALEAEYRERGFSLATVEFSVAGRGDGTGAVEFVGNRGTRLRIRSIDFEGNRVFSATRLRFAMHRTNGANPIHRVLRRDRFDAAALAEDLRTLRALYRNAGYKDVSIDEPRVETVSAESTAADEPPVREIAITIPIHEGDRWQLGAISFAGNRQFGDTRLLETIDRGPGGWLRQDAVDAAMQEIRDLYADSGYLFAQVAPSLAERADHVADLEVEILEGNLVRLGQVEFEGNNRTRDSALRRSLALEEGGLVSGKAIDTSLFRLRQLEFFELDDADPIAFDFGDDPETVDLTVRGHEADPTALQFGGGYGETDGLFATTSVTARNLRGRGETLDLRAQVGTDAERYELAYTVPWLRDRPQDVKFEIFSREQAYDLLDDQDVSRETAGGRLTYGRRFGLFQSLDLSYGYSDVFDRRELVNDGGELATREIDETVSSLRVGYTYDHVDSRLRPTRGTRYSTALEYAGGRLGGTAEYVKGTAAWSWFQPLPSQRAILGLNVQAGAVERYGSAELAYTNLFSLGGQNSVRGFAYSSIWATDREGFALTDDLGFPVGGDRSLQANLEIHFPLSDTFRAIVFSDAGKVLADGQKLDLSNLRQSAGVELRITMPVLGAPLRFIWAENLGPLPDDVFESFQFSVGVSF